MRMIKLNGVKTPVIKAAITTTENPPQPKHEQPPASLKAELKGKSNDAKHWKAAFQRWSLESQTRHEAALAEWRKNRDDIVSLMIEFPDVIVRWMRPRSKIPGRKKTFTMNDVVEIGSRLHIILRDRRDIGAGDIETLPGDAVLRNELTVARMMKEPTMPDSFNTFKDAAEYCGRTEKTLRNWRDTGLLEVTKYGPRKIRITRQALDVCLRHK